MPTLDRFETNVDIKPDMTPDYLHPGVPSPTYIDPATEKPYTRDTGPGIIDESGILIEQVDPSGNKYNRVLDPSNAYPLASEEDKIREAEGELIRTILEGTPVERGNLAITERFEQLGPAAVPYIVEHGESNERVIVLSFPGVDSGSSISIAQEIVDEIGTPQGMTRAALEQVVDKFRRGFFVFSKIGLIQVSLRYDSQSSSPILPSQGLINQTMNLDLSGGMKVFTPRESISEPTYVATLTPDITHLDKWRILALSKLTKTSSASLLEKPKQTREESLDQLLDLIK